jgi:hypothetical protein
MKVIWSRGAVLVAYVARVSIDDVLSGVCSHCERSG